MHTQPTPRPSRARVATAFLALIVLVGACSGGASTPSSGPAGSPDPTTAPSFDDAAIDHLTGPLDVVFRFEEGGGFVPMGFFATQAPHFVLYGDGTVIFRNANAPLPANDRIGALTPYSIARLSEPEIQALLRFALADSGLGVARASYTPGNVADAPTATFTVNAGGLAKTVSVEALGFDNPQSPDVAILRAMAVLGERLRGFDSSVDGETVWTPERWRGVLTPDAFNPPAAWPWPDIVPADFVQPAGQDAPQFPIHTLTAADVAALGLDGIEGGFTSLALTGPDGKTYTLALRPVLPDEER